MNSILSELKDEFKDGGFVRSLTSGALIGIFGVMLAVSFAALIYSGDLSPYLSQGIGFLLMQNLLLILLVALLSSYAGFIAIGQDSPAAILSLAVVSILVLIPQAASAHAKFSTAVVMIFFTTITTGMFFVLLGRFKLGDLVRFLPYPVVGGYLAGTGWLLVFGGLRLMANASTGMDLLQIQSLFPWIPGLAYSILLFLVLDRSDHPAVMPVMLLGGIGLFYLVGWFLKIPVLSLADSGLLLGPFQDSGLWDFPLNVILLDQVYWDVVFKSVVVAFPVLVVSVMALLLNASGMELVSRRDIDLNRELSSAGWGNLLTGLVGGIPGYQTISLSSLNFRLSGGRRLTALIAALVCATVLIFGSTVLAYIPKVLVGALLAYLGLSLLIEWVYKTWFRFPLIEYLVIVLILGVIALFGFLEGVAVGVIAAIILFVVSYSRTDVVKHSLSGLNFRSRVTRNPNQQQVLSEQGERIFILQLQGFIFFGTANRLQEQVRNRIKGMDKHALCFVLLYFRQVSGLDSTAMLSFVKLIQFTAERHVKLVFTNLSGSIHDQFSKGRIFNDDVNVVEFSNLDKGLEWCEDEILKSLDAEEEDRSLYEYLINIYPDPGHINEMLSAMQQKHLEEGYVLIQQGDEADKIFFVEKGQVTAQLEISDGEKIRLETMRGGRIVGEVGFYLGTKRTASVLADENSSVYAFSTQELEELEEKNPHAAAAFHRIVANLMAERVVHLTKTVEALQR